MKKPLQLCMVSLALSTQAFSQGSILSGRFDAPQSCLMKATGIDSQGHPIHIVATPQEVQIFTSNQVFHYPVVVEKKTVVNDSFSTVANGSYKGNDYFSYSETFSNSGGATDYLPGYEDLFQGGTVGGFLNVIEIKATDNGIKIGHFVEVGAYPSCNLNRM